MSTPNINCILQTVLAIQNNQLSPAPQITTVDLGNPTLNGTQFFYEQYIQATVGGTGQGMPGPGGIAYLVIVQNLSPTASMNVQFTPVGGVQTIIKTGPGGVFIYCDPQEQGGINQISIFGLGGTVPALMLVAV